MDLLSLWNHLVSILQLLLQSTLGLLITLGAILTALYAIVTSWRKLKKVIRQQSTRGTGKQHSRPQRAETNKQNAGRSNTRVTAPDLSLGVSTNTVRGNSIFRQSGDRVHVAPKATLAPRIEVEYLTQEEEFIFEEELVYPLRQPAQRALTAVSRLTAAAHDLAQAYYVQPKSSRTYAKQTSFVIALARAYKVFSIEAKALDDALTTLRLFAKSEDPRTVFFTYMDPFHSMHVAGTPEEMLKIFCSEADHIAQTLLAEGYDVKRESDPFDRTHPPTYKLAPIGRK